MLRGIDIASHQGRPLWDAVDKSRMDFVFVKASGGGTYRNEYHDEQADNARRRGAVIGHYHYAHELSFEAHRPFLAYSPEAEAAWFIKCAKPQPGDLLALDIEDPAVPANYDLEEWSLRWLRYVEQATGCKPFLYSYPYYVGEHGLNAWALNRYPLWLASYVTPYRDNWNPTPPSVWPKWTIWQWSGGSKLRGFDFDTDENVFLGTRAELLALGVPGVQAQTKPFVHAPGFIGPPLVDNFNWGGDTAGIIVKRETTVYNDELKQFFLLRWTPEHGVEIIPIK